MSSTSDYTRCKHSEAETSSVSALPSRPHFPPRIFAIAQLGGYHPGELRQSRSHCGIADVLAAEPMEKEIVW